MCKKAMADGRYECTRCKVPKADNEFYASQGRYWCKDCTRAYSRLNNTAFKRARKNAALFMRLTLQERIAQAPTGILMLQAWATA